MIYELPDRDARIDQGDIITGCPLPHLAGFDDRIVRSDVASVNYEIEFCRIVVLTQTCDLAQEKTTTALVARMHDVAELVRNEIVKTADIRGPIRGGRVFGWYFLPAHADHEMPESLIDFRQLHSVRLDLLAALSRAGKRVCRLATPYREHLAQHFAVTYSRIGLPEPYQTQADE